MWLVSIGRERLPTRHRLLVRLDADMPQIEAEGGPNISGIHLSHAEIAEVPFVDRHCIDIAASPRVAWAALAHVLVRSFGGKTSSRFARLLGCTDTAVTGPPLTLGSTVSGFHVAEVQPQRYVALAGRHRFSRYALIFELDGRTLCATTRAEFPGLHGRAYRGLVIGSGGHVVVVKRILQAVRRRAENLPEAPP